jgi:hypothetical protein
MSMPLNQSYAEGAIRNLLTQGTEEEILAVLAAVKKKIADEDNAQRAMALPSLSAAEQNRLFNYLDIACPTGDMRKVIEDAKAAQADRHWGRFLHSVLRVYVEVKGR